MEGVSSEANEENDNIERPMRRRHSSILKPPRSPLQDLRGGNEIVQETNTLRNRKSSRRVSFADTIKVFQTESHMKIVKKSEITETETGENALFIQSKNSDDNYCEISGMNTLLCAPIQTQMQEREFSNIEHNLERKHANDQTVIFSVENQMDLTASHTVMITKGLLDCTKNEKSTKIDTTSFLANLKCHSENSRMKKEFISSTDQKISSEKKINSSDFIKGLKIGKCTVFSTGPDKENFEIPLYSKESNSASSTHQIPVSPNVDENSSNMTGVFIEQDNGMNFTQCQTANIETFVPPSNEANLGEFKGDITIYGNDCMDLTVNHTIHALPSGDDLSKTENQTQNVMMDVTEVSGTKAPCKKSVFENKLNAPFQAPFLSPQHKTHISRSHIMKSENHTVAQTSNQNARTLAFPLEFVCSSPDTQDYKTIFYSSCNDAMELTKCLSSMREEKNLLKHDGHYSKMCPNRDTSPPIIQKAIYSEEDSMDITKSHTITIENQIFKQDQADKQIAATPIPEKEKMLQSHVTVPEHWKVNLNSSSVPQVSKERLQQGLTNSLCTALTDKKIKLLAGDMDLTENHTSNLSQAALASYNLTSENITKSHSYSKSHSDKWEKMAKSHIILSQQPNTSKNILTDTQGKVKHQILKISPCIDKDSSLSADYNQDVATNHNVAYSDVVPDKQDALGNNGNTGSSKQSSFSTTKPLFSLDGHSALKNHNTAMNRHIVKSVLSEHSKLPEPLKKNLDDLNIPHYSQEKMLIYSEEDQTMDLTKNHTVVIAYGPSEVQELNNTNLEHMTSQPATVSRQIGIKVEKCDKSPIEKTGIFVSNDILDALEDKSVQKPEFLKEKQNVKICGGKSVGGLKIDKTIVFSEGDENDMDITKSYTVEINHRPVLGKHGSHLVPLAGTSKTVLYTSGQDEMEITRSHTTALECKTVSLEEVTTRPMDKTVMFIQNHDELEMTKSHTVFIDFQAEEKTVLPDRLNFELPKRKSLREPKMTSTPAEESICFSENGESSHPAAKCSQLTVLEEWSKSVPGEETVAFKADDNMEVSKLTTWKNVKDVQKPGFPNECLSGKSQSRKSLRLKNDKTIAFSENDKNDTDNTQSCMVETGKKSSLEDRQDFSLVSLAELSKTVLYACRKDDMEITRNHTTASECKTLSTDEITRPMDKTVMFIDNHNDLEVTKSHTVFIDCQATEKILQEYPKFAIPGGKNLSFYFPKDDGHVQEITKKQALAIEKKVVFSPEQQHHMTSIIPINTLLRDQSKMEIINYHRADMDEEVIGKVVDQAYTLEETKVESCHLNSTRRNVDFASSHVAAICGSSGNYSCLPNVISSFDNLKDNVMSLYDKNREKAKNCLVQNDLAYADDLASDYYLEFERVLVSAPCHLSEKEEVIQTNSNEQLDCAITRLNAQDLMKEPQNLLANQSLVSIENLGEMNKLNSKRVSFKLPKDQIEAFVNDICVPSQSYLSKSTINKDETMQSTAGNKTLHSVIGNSSATTREDESKMLDNEKPFPIAYKKELQESIQTTNCNTVTDFPSNSNLTTQVIQTHANAREASEPKISSNALCFSGVEPNQDNLGKTEEILDFQSVHLLTAPEQLPELGSKVHNNMSIMQATETRNIVSNDAKDNRIEENKNSHNGLETTSTSLKKVVKDKMRRCSLGIFLPKLPNKKKCSVTGIDDLKLIPANTTGLNHLETQEVFSKDSGIESVAAKLNLSPSQYINEEHLPIYPGEINSSDSVSIEIEENALTETHQKEILPSENKMEETCNSEKRTWVQEEGDVPHEKKMRKCEVKLGDTTQEQEVFDHYTEGDIDKNVNSILIKSPSRTPSSCSSSLDSIKADGTSLDFSTHRNSQMESQFLSDTICEESLREKLKDGRITIREFFILLQVHILIQKPRQSDLPAKFTINTSPTPEDLMLRQYVYGPKIQIYREDCEVLRQKIEELKVSALNQDKLLTTVNRNLWEKMRHCSDEELKAFGIYLNKIKSRSTKMTKVFTHQGKVALYSKLVQSAQNEREKLQIRINEMDNILKKINNCLTEVEIETKNLEDEEKDNPEEEWNSEMRAADKELEHLKSEEEDLQRKLLELEIQKKQTLAQIDIMQKQTNRTEELLDQLSLSEWDVIEWSDDQAVFTFVYGTIELTITFGEPGVGLPFLDKAYRKIAELNFQSLLDEDKAPPSSLLVHKLIFLYIEEQESWKKKCTTQHQVPQMLQELSLVVNNCRLLGEEIEFLKRWGPNYNLMDVNVNNTELRLLFSSSVAFTKFEITLSLSAHYPLVPLPFTIQNHLGNTGHDEIITIISKVPLEDNYVKNVVKQIYQDLLQDCHFCH